MNARQRLIDADVLREEVYSWGMNDYEPSDFTDAIDDALTVEAIPKDQYEARLKADMVAILDKVRAEIKALSPKPTAYDVVDGNPVKDAIWETLIEVDKIIDKYKGESEP